MADVPDAKRTVKDGMEIMKKGWREWWTRTLSGADPRCGVIQKVGEFPLYAKGISFIFR